MKRKFTNLGDDVVANGHNFDAAKILSISIFKRKKEWFDIDLPLVKTKMHTHTCTELNGV